MNYLYIYCDIYFTICEDFSLLYVKEIESSFFEEHIFHLNMICHIKNLKYTTLRFNEQC
jgi:hypothetical protein